MPETAAYGSWRSPITTELITADSVRFQETDVDGDDLYWTEMRPSDAARYVPVQRAADGTTRDLIAAPWSARTLVHEYGGGAFVAADGVGYFSNFADQRLYRVDRGGGPRPLTPEGKLRYADACVDRARGRLICVAEDHGASNQEAENRLVAVPLAGGDPVTLHRGQDFYATPRLSPDGCRLGWLCWNHPQMPWDGTELWVADLDADGALRDPRKRAGGPRESIFQPQWAPDGRLYCVSDRSGWWNLYRLDGGALCAICPMEAEFGEPLWVFSESLYDFLPDGRIAAAYAERGTWRLGTIDPARGALTPVETEFTAIAFLRVLGGAVVCVAASPTKGSAVVRIDLATGAVEEIRRGSRAEIDPGYLSPPETIAFPSSVGRTAHGFYYAPRNRDFTGPPGERPPLLVTSHGGPTSQALPALNLPVQYWTSRGLGVLDVNYGGSSGYGTAYRRQLDGNWGVTDVDDCCAGARFLVERGDVDAERLAIRGGSAGGYTTLCALTFRDVFAAGASHYGVSDAEALARDTHKFESRYLDSMIGPYPQRAELYRQRSPLHAVDRLDAPMILFQGLEDRIVPPDQAERMVEALRKKGVPVAYVAFEGEQHGFRKAESIRRALEAELYFYGRIFGFAPADRIEAVAIENL